MASEAVMSDPVAQGDLDAFRERAVILVGQRYGDDVPRLLAEVERLRAEDARTREQIVADERHRLRARGWYRERCTLEARLLLVLERALRAQAERDADEALAMAYAAEERAQLNATRVLRANAKRIADVGLANARTERAETRLELAYEAIRALARRFRESRACLRVAERSAGRMWRQRDEACALALGAMLRLKEAGVLLANGREVIHPLGWWTETPRGRAARLRTVRAEVAEDERVRTLFDMEPGYAKVREALERARAKADEEARGA